MVDLQRQVDERSGRRLLDCTKHATYTATPIGMRESRCSLAQAEAARF